MKSFFRIIAAGWRRPGVFWPAFLLILCAIGLGTKEWYGQRRWETAFPEGLQALELGDQSAVESAIDVLQRDPGRASEVHVLRAGLFMRRQDWHAALDEFAQVQPLGDVRFPALRMAGECFYRVGRIVQAEGLMRQLASEDPSNVAAHRWLGAIYYDMGANYQSIAELEVVARLDPRDFASHRLIGLMHMDFEQYPLAIHHYRAALDRHPPPPIRQEVLLELGKCLMAERDYQGAIDVLKQCEPAVIAYSRLSECYWSLGQHEECERSLEKARVIDPEDRSVLFLQARIDLHAGQMERAERALRKIVQRDPADKDAHYQLALVYQGLGDAERQQMTIARWQELEALYQRLSDLSQEAIEKPGDADLRDQLADTCEALGKLEIAAAWRRLAQVLRASTPPPPIAPTAPNLRAAGGTGLFRASAADAIAAKPDEASTVAD